VKKLIFLVFILLLSFCSSDSGETTNENIESQLLEKIPSPESEIISSETQKDENSAPEAEEIEEETSEVEESEIISSETQKDENPGPEAEEIEEETTEDEESEEYYEIIRRGNFRG